MVGGHLPTEHKLQSATPVRTSMFIRYFCVCVDVHRMNTNPTTYIGVDTGNATPPRTSISSSNSSNNNNNDSARATARTPTSTTTPTKQTSSPQTSRSSNSYSNNSSSNNNSNSSSNYTPERSRPETEVGTLCVFCCADHLR